MRFRAYGVLEYPLGADAEGWFSFHFLSTGFEQISTTRYRPIKTRAIVSDRLLAAVVHASRQLARLARRRRSET